LPLFTQEQSLLSSTLTGAHAEGVEAPWWMNRSIFVLLAPLRKLDAVVFLRQNPLKADPDLPWYAMITRIIAPAFNKAYGQASVQTIHEIWDASLLDSIFGEASTRHIKFFR
jgi:hypothetical protein